MDTTDKYILMCKESPFRREYEWQKGDLLFDPPHRCFMTYLGYEKLPYSPGIHRFLKGHTIFCKDIIPYHYVLLWRQDQLQEMFRSWQNCTWENVRIAFHIFDVEKSTGMQSWTNEQLWLAFVMQEKYNKIWDDEKEKWLS
jgi:hypothetical protein